MSDGVHPETDFAVAALAAAELDRYARPGKLRP
jgi:hypothetical protein